MKLVISTLSIVLMSGFCQSAYAAVPMSQKRCITNASYTLEIANKAMPTARTANTNQWVVAVNKCRKLK